jgi:uncharacterized membrane protein YdbT with pleckstrin-like domain
MTQAIASNINPAISISKADYTNTYYYFWIDNTIILEVVFTGLGSQFINWAADAPQVWQDNFDMTQAWPFINEYNLRTQMMA